MTVTVLNEWYIDAPWGKIALISWGIGTGKPILMVHGRQDSSATYIPLLEMLPSGYHYVAVDLPGHGKSDPFPKGVVLHRIHFLSAIEIAIKHLGWTNFIFFGHSLGAELGLLYNAIYPGKIIKFLLLDPGPPFERARNRPQPEFFKIFFQNYYDQYDKMNVNDRVYTRRKALEAVMKARNMTEQQAELILSRNLSEVGPDRYKLSWDKRLANPAPLNLPDESYAAIYKSNFPPTIIIMATGTSVFNSKTDRMVNDFFKEMPKTNKNTKVLEIDGGHDVHFTNPERFSGDVCQFLERDFNMVVSKL